MRNITQFAALEMPATLRCNAVCYPQFVRLAKIVSYVRARREQSNFCDWDAPLKERTVTGCAEVRPISRNPLAATRISGAIVGALSPPI